MQVKALERLIASRGVGASKADAITRNLRESGYLPLGGRGPNAPRIGPTHAAILLIAVAGSPRSAEASARVDKLADLISTATGSTLVEALKAALADRTQARKIHEVRIARTRRRAVFVDVHGEAEEFVREGKELRNGRFFVEGILPGELITAVANALAGRPLTADAEADDD